MKAFFDDYAKGQGADPEDINEWYRMHFSPLLESEVSRVLRKERIVYLTVSLVHSMFFLLYVVFTFHMKKIASLTFLCIYFIHLDWSSVATSLWQLEKGGAEGLSAFPLCAMEEGLSGEIAEFSGISESEDTSKKKEKARQVKGHNIYFPYPTNKPQKNI